MIAKVIKADTNEAVRQFDIAWFDVFDVEEEEDGKVFSFSVYGDEDSYQDSFITERGLKERQYIISVSDKNGEFFKFGVSGD